MKHEKIVLKMFVVKCIIAYLGLAINILGAKCLTELPVLEDVGILSTEAIIRHTLNKLFHHLKLKSVRDKPKLMKYSIVHNSLVLITLQDHDVLKNIAKTTRVDSNNMDNSTEQFLSTIDELLNEDSSLTNDAVRNTREHDMAYDDNVINIIQEFLNKLEELKVKHGVVNQFNKSDINTEILKILRDDHHLINQAHNSLITGDNDVLLENEFWKPSGRRIYRGKKTNIKHYPFMASIQIMNQFHCAGSIIKSDLVISAASCLQLAYNNRFFRENPAFLAVRVGSSYFNGAGELIPVLEVYFHPSYDPKTLRNNLCIMRLLRRLNFRSRRVKKIDIDREPSSLPVTTDGITVVGWGPKKSSNIIKGSAIDQMSFSVLDFYPLSECRDVYSREFVTRTNFCAGFFSRGGGACNRDVGGPGIVNGILNGVISFGSHICGAENSPTVFMKIGYYATWIDDILERDVPYKKMRTTTTTTRNLIYTMPRLKTPTKYTLTPIESGETSESDHDRKILRQDTNITEKNALSEEDDDPELFREFLRTIFGSTEVQELEESLAFNTSSSEKAEEIDLAVTAKVSKQLTKAIPERLNGGKRPKLWTDQTSKKLTTKERNIRSEENLDRKFTVMDMSPNDDGETESEKDIKRMSFDNKKQGIETPDSESDNSNDESEETEEIMLEVPKYHSGDAVSSVKPTYINELKQQALEEVAQSVKLLEYMKHVTKPSYTYMNDSVLTLLYLSDTDKKSSKIEGDTGNINDPPADNNMSSNDKSYDFLSKQDLYDILKDAITSEAEKLINKKEKEY